MSFILQRECGEVSASSKFSSHVSSHPKLYERFALDCVLENHAGPVNDASFNRNGELLVSCSDDRHVNIWNVNERQLKLSWQTNHTANIFSVIFLPESNDGVIVSAAGDGQVQLHDLNAETTQTVIYHHDRVKVVQAHPDMSNVLYSCSEDKSIKSCDLRINGAEVVAKMRNPLHTFDICKSRPWLLAMGGASDILKIFDLRNIKDQRNNPQSVWSISMGDLDKRDDSEGITGVQFSNDGSEILANFLSNYVYLLSVYDNDGRNLGLPTQKRKRIEHATNRSLQRNASEGDDIYKHLRKAVKRLSQGDYHGTRLLASEYLASYSHCWQMHYILIKSHVFERKLEAAMKAVQKGIRKVNHPSLVDLQNEIIEQQTRASSRQIEATNGVDCVEMAEMVNLLGLYYDVLFPDGMEEDMEVNGLVAFQTDDVTDHWEDIIPDNAETLLQLIDSPIGGVVDQDDDSTLYDWGWYQQNQEWLIEGEVSDRHEAMLAAIGKSIALGNSSYHHRNDNVWNMRYRGHVHTSTIKSVSFLTPEQKLVCAGSDDGHLFIWEKETGAILTTLKGDRYAVNGAMSHPLDPMVASWGVDDTVKIWTPSLPQKPIRGKRSLILPNPSLASKVIKVHLCVL